VAPAAIRAYIAGVGHRDNEMDRRGFLAAGAAAVLAGARRAQAGELSLDAVSAYLNGIVTAESGFTQFNADGSQTRGKVYIRRPGRMRFEYAPPEELLVMAGGGQIGIFDGKSNLKKAERYPLSRTPLNLILERQVNLKARNMVVGKQFDGTATIVVAQDPAHPEYGTIAMSFSDNPVALSEWVVTDGQGARTRVVLDGLNPAGDLPSTLFNITYEENRRGG